MPQFSRYVSDMDGLFDELVAARGSSASLAAEIATKQDTLGFVPAPEDVLAPVEESTTAAEAHNARSIFMLGGDLLRALSKIEIGDTISAANAVETTIANEIVFSSYFKVGTEIPRGADLDDYKQFGVFYVGSGANAGDTSHTPTNKAGRVEVFPLWGSARLIQRYYTYTNSEAMYYLRGFNGTSWGNWFLFSGTDSGAGAVYTYTLVASQPGDWATSYKNYYTKSETEFGAYYTKVSGDSAPSWAADTYYSRATS